MKAKEVVDPKVQEEIIALITDCIIAHGLTRGQTIDVAQKKGYELNKKNYAHFHRLVFVEMEKKTGVMRPNVAIDSDEEKENKYFVRKLQQMKYDQKKELKKMAKAAIPGKQVWKEDKEIINFITKRDE